MAELVVLALASVALIGMVRVIHSRMNWVGGMEGGLVVRGVS